MALSILREGLSRVSFNARKALRRTLTKAYSVKVNKIASNSTTTIMKKLKSIDGPESKIVNLFSNMYTIGYYTRK